MLTSFDSDCRHVPTYLVHIPFVHGHRFASEIYGFCCLKAMQFAPTNFESKLLRPGSNCVVGSNCQKLRPAKSPLDQTPFVSKLLPDGSEIWTSILETDAITYANDVTQDGGNIYFS